jgi:4-deoxy-L-threo-5-hexosulose-uronate ketol-isomerase
MDGTMNMRYSPGPNELSSLDTKALRSHFLVTDLFQQGRVSLHVIDLDRAVIGGAVPGAEPLVLETIDHLRSEYFLERREAGILNIGGPGSVAADGTEFSLSVGDVLYVSRGTRDVRFFSADPSNPAKFYIVSYPAHSGFTTTLIRAEDAQANELGTSERANRRRIARYIHREGARSAQLVMGVTVLEPGSVWNTMPAHTHDRRSEIYLYFNLPADAMVVHLLGKPQETRSLIVRNGEAALSPGWSIHAGCGTSSYAFCWAMGGENQDYADMDPVAIEDIR